MTEFTDIIKLGYNDIFGERSGVIGTLTLNPSLDVFVGVDGLTLGGTNRSEGKKTVAGGKGINVSRMLSEFDTSTIAYFPVGGENGKKLISLIEGENIAHRCSSVLSETRVNYKFSDIKTGETTEVNERGGPMTEYELEPLLSMLFADFPIMKILVISGSLPQGVSPMIYETVINRAKAAGIYTVLDTSGEALSYGLMSRPDMIKPNIDELSYLCGKRIISYTDAEAECRSIFETYGTRVLCTLGKDGALYMGDGGMMRFDAPRVVPKTTTGAGDAYLAGFVYGIYSGLDIDECAECAGEAVKIGFNKF